MIFFGKNDYSPVFEVEIVSIKKRILCRLSYYIHWITFYPADNCNWFP